MKTLLVLSLLGFATVLSGCAPAPLTKADVDGRIVCNSDRMSQVERTARRDNRQVVWLHCPEATLRVAS